MYYRYGNRNTRYQSLELDYSSICNLVSYLRDLSNVQGWTSLTFLILEYFLIVDAFLYTKLYGNFVETHHDHGPTEV